MCKIVKSKSNKSQTVCRKKFPDEIEKRKENIVRREKESNKNKETIYREFFKETKRNI